MRMHVPGPCGASRLALTLLAALAILASGCSEDSTAPPEEFAPPTSLTFVNDDGSVSLTWTGSTSAGVSDFDGYNVYRHTASMAGMSATQVAAYKLNAGFVTGTRFTDNGLSNGEKHYYAVRAVRGETTLSQPSNEIHTAARKGGTEVANLAEFAYAGQPSGLNCDETAAYAMSSSEPDNRAKIDVYLGTTGNNDESDQALALKSPHRVLNGAAPWADRQADLLLLGSDAAAWNIGQPPDGGPWENEIRLGTTSAEVVGKVIAVRTPADGSGNRHYAKIQVLAFPPAPEGERVIEVRVAYQPLADYPRFRSRP